MAQIAAKNDTSILKIDAFLGLNENPDGDTTLKMGEFSEMRNFRITQDRHLQIRPGTKTLLDLSTLLPQEGESGRPAAEAALHGVWRGSVGAKERTLAAYGGHIWECDVESGSATDRGALTAAETTFFGFGGKVYALNGHEYLAWDGSEDGEFSAVEGYIPIVYTAVTPEGSGTELEPVNRLHGWRRVEFSPDGTAKVFQLPETEISEVKTVVQVKVTDGKPTDTEITDYDTDPVKGTLTFKTVPEKGTNTMTVTYRKGDGAKEDVTKMRHCELFNGASDTRVFLYGDGSNKTIYSGVEYASGAPSAEYFPDLYEAAIGESNTPITALVRHYSRMMAFKPNSAWVISQSTLTLADDRETAAFYVQPVNRQIGNEAAGQVHLLENNPLTLDGGSVYQWRSTSSSGYVTNTENNARRISDRVATTLSAFSLRDVKTFNLKTLHEYWFLQGGRALILNYANDAWYFYDNLPFSRLLEQDGEIYGFCEDGRVVHFDRLYRNDDGEDLDCYAATGAMDFSRDWVLKYSPMIFVAMQPESGARITVTVESNRRSDYPEKLVAYGLATFRHVDFKHFSFGTNRKPQVKRVKMKVKKATFYKMIFKSKSASATATVLETDVQVRYAGNVK